MAWSSDLLQLDRAPVDADCLGVALTVGVALCCTTGAESGTLSPRSSEMRFHLLRTESSERPARCGAIARQRVPCCAMRLWMAASSSADHVLRWYPGLVGRPVESRASEPASASACISCDAACAAAAAAAVLALGVRVLVTAATACAALEASSCGPITPCVMPWAM
eukprot:scaffold76166_cov69-Phaeocystis_antarctica.AAC.3